MKSKKQVEKKFIEIQRKFGRHAKHALNMLLWVLEIPNPTERGYNEKKYKEIAEKLRR